MNNQIIIISGPSGVGKGTVIKKLLQASESYEVAISVTTRAQRVGETEGVDYYFYSVDKFEKELQTDSFIETCLVHGNYYGTLKSEVNRIHQKGNKALLEIDTQGAKKIKEKI